MMRPWFRFALLGLLLETPFPALAADRALLKEASIDVREPSEVVAAITAVCHRCDWGRAGREAAALRIDVDGRYSQHLYLTRGAEKAPYRVLLGPQAAGSHKVTITRDDDRSARDAGEATIEAVEFSLLPASHPENNAVALAPILYARPNTLGKFSDMPLYMWYETDRTERGSRIRYSVIFSNEDGGTPADRLLATWGRLTDVEYVYGIEFDHEGRVLEETFQGKDHEIVAFKGRREGRHPLLYVVTDNNMVGAVGTTDERYAPAPVGFDLTDASREKVMDENPWTYAVTAKEARREGRVSDSPAPDSKRIFDPRRYAVVEICTESEDTTFATFTFALGVGHDAKRRFFDSTRGVNEYRISRSPDNFPNSCFRGAVALPSGTKASDISAIQVAAHARPVRKGEAPPANPKGPAHLRRINRVFVMNDADEPGPNAFSWTGKAVLALDGAPATLEFRIARTSAQ